MKEAIHPKFHEAVVTCGGCASTFTTGSVLNEIRINVCSECHPFYTGKQKLLDTAGRIDRFNKKYAR
jgi:large subunit ribosomal protein L31